MRDWLSTLWPASFRGVPFFIESDEEHGGRRIAVHQFPGRDQPFLEDLGEDVRGFQVTAYLVGDSSDSDASGFVAGLVRPGAGTLVLPTHGSINARVHKYSRDRSRDRMGYIAFRLEFVRDGAQTPLISALYLAQLVYDAGTGLAAIMAAAAASGLLVQDRPGWIVSDTIAAVQDIPARLETIRAASVIDPETSRLLATRLADNFNAVPDAVDDGGFGPIISDAVEIARDLAEAIGPENAVVSFGAELDGIVLSAPATMTTTENARIAAGNIALASRLDRLALLIAYVDSVTSREYASRPAGIAARVEMVARFAVDLGECRSATDHDLYTGILDLRGRAVEHMSATIADLRPIVTVMSGEPMPALWWAWRLYQDPERVQELVAMNKVKHPAWMPERFSALSPS
jgi:hypothetical protein